MSQEAPKSPYAPDDPRYILVKSFVRRLFEIEDSGRPLVGIGRVAREELQMQDASEQQVKSAIRYIGANFFTIFGYKQPTTAKKYREVLDAIRDDVAKDTEDVSPPTTQ